MTANRSDTAATPSLRRELALTARGWVRHRSAERSAALAFYTLFSLAPVLYLSVSLASVVLDPDTVRNELFGEVASLVGPEAAEFLADMLAAAVDSPGGFWRQILGIGTLLFGATAVFGQLQDSLNAAWEVKPRQGPLVASLLRKRFASLTLVVVLGVLLLVSLVFSTAVSAAAAYLARHGAAPLGFLEVGNFAVSFLTITLLIASLYRICPDAEIAWRDVALGACLTSLLFVIGKSVIGAYLGRSGLASSYGATGSLVLVLLWVYYSSLIMLFGAEFTRVHSRRFRPGRVQPEVGAARTDDAVSRHEETDESPPAEPKPEPGGLV